MTRIIFLLLFNLISFTLVSQQLEQLSNYADYEFNPRTAKVITLEDKIYVAFEDLSFHITVLEVKKDIVDIVYRSESMCDLDIYGWTFHEYGLVYFNSEEIVIQDIFENSISTFDLPIEPNFQFRNDIIFKNGSFVNFSYQNEIFFSLDVEHKKLLQTYSDNQVFETDSYYYSHQTDNVILRYKINSSSIDTIAVGVNKIKGQYFTKNDSLFYINEIDEIIFFSKTPEAFFNLGISKYHVVFVENQFDSSKMTIYDKATKLEIDTFSIKRLATENFQNLNFKNSSKNKIYFTRTNSNRGKLGIYNIELDSISFIKENVYFSLENQLNLDTISIIGTWDDGLTFLINTNKNTITEFLIEDDNLYQSYIQFWQADDNIYMRQFNPEQGLEYYLYNSKHDQLDLLEHVNPIHNGIGNKLSSFNDKYAVLSNPYSNNRIRLIDTLGEVFESPVLNNVILHVGWVNNDYYYFTSEEDPSAFDTLTLSLKKYNRVNQSIEVLIKDLWYDKNVANIFQLRTYQYGQYIFSNLKVNDKYLTYNLENREQFFITQEILDLIQRVESYSDDYLYCKLKGLHVIELSDLTNSYFLFEDFEKVYSNSDQTVVIKLDSVALLKGKEILWSKYLDVNKFSKVNFLKNGKFVISGLTIDGKSICIDNEGIATERLPKGSVHQYRNGFLILNFDNSMQSLENRVGIFDSQGQLLYSQSFEHYQHFIFIDNDEIHLLDTGERVIRKLSSTLSLLNTIETKQIDKEAWIFNYSSLNLNKKYFYAINKNQISLFSYDVELMEINNLNNCLSDLLFHSLSYFNGNLYIIFSSFEEGYQLYKLKAEQLPSSNHNITIETNRLFPNPTNNKIQLTSFDLNSPYTIYSIAGSILAKGILSADGTLDVSNLNEGLHIIKYTSNSRLTSTKFLKIE